MKTGEREEGRGESGAGTREAPARVASLSPVSPLLSSLPSELAVVTLVDQDVASPVSSLLSPLPSSLSPSVVVVDSGVGNIPNAVRGLQRVGAEVTLSGDPDVVARAERLVVPGVGAFPAAMARLRAADLDAAIRAAAERGVPVLGICLGHQLLFEASEEFGETPGLGLLAGRVVPLPPGTRVPHMGWSPIRATARDPLVAGLDGAFVYFVHSFAVLDAADAVATVDVGGVPVCAAARRGTVCGAQFHPEKSGAPGARFLSNFLDLPR